MRKKPAVFLGVFGSTGGYGTAPGRPGGEEEEDLQATTMGINYSANPRAPRGDPGLMALLAANHTHARYASAKEELICFTATHA